MRIFQLCADPQLLPQQIFSTAMLGYVAVSSALVLLAVCVPHVIEVLTRRKFPVHRTGAVIVTGERITAPPSYVACRSASGSTKRR